MVLVARVTSIAPIRRSSNVSGPHQASAAALRIRGCFSRTSRAIPARATSSQTAAELDEITSFEARVHRTGVFTFAACPALQRSIRERRRCSEVGSPV